MKSPESIFRGNCEL